MGESATILKADKDHCFAIWRNVLIFVWRGATKHEVCDDHRKYIETHVARGRGPLSLFVITEAQVEMPDGATREKLATVLQAATPVGRCSALVFEGSGFRAAAIRGVTSVLNTIARQAYPYKSFGTVEAGASWVASMHADGKGASVRAEDLTAVVPPLRMITSMPSVA